MASSCLVNIHIHIHRQLLHSAFIREISLYNKQSQILLAA